MKNAVTKFLILCAIALTANSVHTLAEPTVAIQPQALDTFIKTRDLTLIKQFDTDAPALKGYLLKDKSGKYGVVYTVQDLLILGKILDANGEVVSEKYHTDNVPKPDFSRAVTTLEKDKMLVVEGKKSAPIIYVFADPNCIFCHKFYDETRTWVAQGKVQIRWIMVGFLKPSSPGRAAAILAAKNRTEANAQDHAEFDAKTEEGSIAELQPIPAAIQETLNSHSALMNELQFQGTPGLLFKDKNLQWQGSEGMPPVEQLAEQMGITL